MRPSSTLTLTKTFKCNKSVVNYKTFVADPYLAFTVKTEELTEDLQNFLSDLERRSNNERL